MVAAAVVGGAVVGGVASNMAANKAAGAQTSAAKDSNATQLAMYNQTRADQTPWRNAGNQSLSELMYEMGLSDPNAAPAAEQLDTSRENFDANAYLQAHPDIAHALNTTRAYDDRGDMADRAWAWYNDRGLGTQFTPLHAPAAAGSTTHPGGYGSLTKQFSLADFNADPGYQFRMDQGLKGVQSSAAARGGLLNGGTLKALTQYGQDFASNEYGNAYNRFNNDQSTRFNRLSTIAGIGQTANNTIAGAGSNYANNVSQNQLAVGNANAANAIATGNAINNGINNISSYYTMKSLFGNNGQNQNYGNLNNNSSGNYYVDRSAYA